MGPGSIPRCPVIQLLPRLFQSAPALDHESREWIDGVFAWALQQPDWQGFLSRAHLVQPVREHFPGEADSHHGMAQLVFDSVREHAGLAGSPFRLAQPDDLLDEPVPLGPIPGSDHAAAGPAAGPASIPIAYPPPLAGNPQALIAHFAREIGLRIAPTAREPAPAHAGNEPHIAELLGVLMGFGIMLANTAFSVRVNQCGACKGPAAERDAALSRDDLAYALARFCQLRDVPPARARGHLNAPLRPVFRRCLRDVARDPAALPRP